MSRSQLEITGLCLLMFIIITGAAHFKGAVLQWRPNNPDPHHFQGEVQLAVS